MAANAVSIADLKNNLSAHLARVRRGEEVLIRDRRTPIAKIVPLVGADDFTAEELALVAEGKLRLPKRTGPLPASFWKDKVPKFKTNIALEMLREDRDAR